MNAPLLQLQNVSKHYGSARTPIIAVSEVNLQLHAGRNLALVGESGSGKSTLARLVMEIGRAHV